MRRFVLLGAVAVGLAGLAWLLLRTDLGDERALSRNIAPADSGASRDPELWLERGSGAEESIERRHVRARDATEEKATLGFGVRVRVVDAERTPLLGWPVVLLKMHPGWRELAKSEKVCEPARSSRNCGACHATQSKSEPVDWAPNELEGTFAADPIIARAVTSAPSGEVFFAIEPATPDGYSVRVETILDRARELSIQPNHPPPLVELAVGTHELLQIRVEDDESWRLRLRFTQPWIDAGQIAIASQPDPYELRRGDRFALPYESAAPPRVDAWIAKPFAPRLQLEPEARAEGAVLALDAREHTCRATVRLLEEDGTACGGETLTASLYQGASRADATLQSDAEGRLRFFLPAGASSGARGLTFKRFSPSAIRFADGSTFEDPRESVHLELAPALSAGTEVDFGSVRFGTGPLLVDGRAVDPMRRPIPYATIHVHDPSAAFRCDASGRFHLRGFAVSPTIALSGSAPGYSSWNTLRVDLPAADVELVLDPATSLSLRVLAPAELLRVPLTLHVRQEPASSEGAEMLWNAQAEAFDLEGRVAFGDLPAKTLYFSLRAANIDLHEFTHTLVAGANELPVLDLQSFVQPLRFRLARAPGESKNASLAGFSTSEKLFEQIVVFAADGTLDLWVPLACRSWTLTVDDQEQKGSVAMLQPIELR